MDVISGTEISGEVLKLIEGAREFLVLVTPYFDPWDRLATEIKRAKSKPGVKVRLLLRGGEDREKQEPKARELAAYGVEVAFLKRLHAKVYISDSQAIVTSMNLIKSSALDSWEIALRADSVKDATTYRDIALSATNLLQRAHDEEAIAAQPHRAAAVASMAAVLGKTTPGTREQTAPTRPSTTPDRSTPAPLKPSPARAPVLAAPPVKSKRTAKGHCIRCNAEVSLNPDLPYCDSCYKSWVKYQNPDYEEKHCHSCGKAKATTMAKPLCKPCWEASA